MLNISTRLKTVALFIIALAPRLPGLDRFLTSDENTNIFFAGSDVIVAFLRGDFRGTYWHFYPGVTMSWLDALGMSGQYLLDSLAGKSLPPFTDYIYSPILSLVVANRLPYVLLTAAAIPLIYWLARQLLPERVALLGALFLAFDPFFLAHSRVAHGDAPVAVFMALSALTFFIYLRRVSESANQPRSVANEKISLSSFILPPSSFYLIASAVFGSLAALTKAPGQFMPLFVVGMSIIYAIRDIWQLKNKIVLLPTPVGNKRQKTSSFILHPSSFRISVITVWGIVSLVVFVLLWPAMWVAPLETIGRMWNQTFVKVDEGHLVYFFGQPTLNPGPWFYPYVIPFRMTPITLIGAALSLALLVPQINTLTPHASRFTLLLLWLFVISLLLFGTLSPKKQDRYLLPLFPFLDLLAALGWTGLINLARQSIRDKRIPSLPFLLLLTPYSLLLFFHLLPTFTYYPYYLAYFNPLMGGPTCAA
ncbi:MAG: glycosyltransferase family 39 protein [Anaerolineae bacterium]